MNRIVKVTTLALWALLAACGGGGGGGGGGSGNNGGSGGGGAEEPAPPRAPVTARISGTAATGGAIVGKIALIQADGSTQETTTDEEGEFTFVLPGVNVCPCLLAATTPFAPRGAYKSIAFDGEEIVNVTPLTHLILGTTVGKHAEEVTIQDVTGLTRDGYVKAVHDTLRDRIAPLIRALGPTLDVDRLSLRTTAFAANTHVGVDAVLDVLQIVPSEDASQPKATIINKADYSEISHDLKDNSKNTSILPASSASVGLSVSALVGAQQIASEINRLLGDASIQSRELRVNLPALIHDDFAFYGEDKTTFIEMLADADAVGAQAAVINLTGSTANGDAIVHFTAHASDGSLIYDDLMALRRDAQGRWQLLGNPPPAPLPASDRGVQLAVYARGGWVTLLVSSQGDGLGSTTCTPEQVCQVVVPEGATVIAATAPTPFQGRRTVFGNRWALYGEGSLNPSPCPRGRWHQTCIFKATTGQFFGPIPIRPLYVEVDWGAPRLWQVHVEGTVKSASNPIGESFVLENPHFSVNFMRGPEFINTASISFNSRSIPFGGAWGLLENEVIGTTHAGISINPGANTECVLRGTLDIVTGDEPAYSGLGEWHCSSEHFQANGTWRATYGL